MRESELERILVKEVRDAGGKAYKWISPGNDGVPDRIIFFPAGEIYFVELKTERGKLRSQQVVQMKKLESLGQRATVVYGIGGVITFFREIGRPEIAGKLERRYGGDA